jgi:sugar O-acyltransferase (sialic acid O-acetyltransferase NeuD family)
VDALVIIGAGGFAREVYSWLRGSRRLVTGFIGEGDVSGRSIYGIPVYSSIGAFTAAVGRCSFIVAIGDPKAREAAWSRAIAAELVPCKSIVHSSVVLGYDVEIGDGSIVCPGSILTTNVKIGQGCILNLHTTVGHDAELKSFVTTSPGVKVSGNVTIGSNSYIGTGAVIREKLMIGSGVTVGMGAVVVKDLLDPGTYVGNPAKKLSKGG